MAIKHPDDVYGADGSVPDKVGFDPTPGMGVRANPDDFGAATGKAVAGLGETGGKTLRCKPAV